MIIVWSFEATTDDTIYNAQQEYMIAFQDYFAEMSASFEADYNLDIFYLTSRSVDDEMSRVFIADAPIYMAAIIVMVIYLSLTLGKFHLVYARPWLAISTVFVMILALIMGYGLGLAFGFAFNNLVLLVPYILLGVGVDDQIIIAESVDRTPYPNGDLTKGAERLQEALKHSGLSITLTSFCSVMAFAIGSLVDIAGVSSFCVFASCCFLANDS